MTDFVAQQPALLFYGFQLALIILGFVLILGDRAVFREYVTGLIARSAAPKAHQGILAAKSNPAPLGKPGQALEPRPRRRAPDDLPGWEKLFLVEDDGAVRLHFMPDTDTPRKDALCLVVFGYEFIKGLERIPTKMVDAEMRRLLLSAERTPLQKMMGAQWTVTALAIGDFGDPAIKTGDIERIDLAMRVAAGKFAQSAYTGLHAADCP